MDEKIKTTKQQANQESDLETEVTGYIDLKVEGWKVKCLGFGVQGLRICLCFQRHCNHCRPKPETMKPVPKA